MLFPSNWFVFQYLQFSQLLLSNSSSSFIRFRVVGVKGGMIKAAAACMAARSSASCTWALVRKSTGVGTGLLLQYQKQWVSLARPHPKPMDYCNGKNPSTTSMLGQWCRRRTAARRKPVSVA